MTKNKEQIALLKQILKTVLIVTPLALIIFVGGTLFLFFNPLNKLFPSNSDKQFMNTCERLEGSKFNYESISRISGHILLEDDGGMPQLYSVKDATDQKIQDYIYKPKYKYHDGSKIVVYKNNNFGDGWACVLYPNQNGTIVSKVTYHFDD